MLRIKEAEDRLRKEKDLLEELVLERTYKLKESEEKHKAIYENAPLSYQSLNEDGSLKDVNPTWLKTMGYQREEVIGKWFGDFLHPDWKTVFEKSFPIFKKQGHVHDIHFKIRHKTGHYLDILFEGCIGHHPDGSFKQTYCVFQDITLRKLADKEIRKLSTAVEQSPSVIVITDLNGIIEYANPKFSELTGYTSTEVLGKNPRILKSGKQSTATYKEMWDTISAGKEWRGELHNKKKNGDLFWESAIMAPIFDKEGQITNYIKVAEDITEQKRAEENLRQSYEQYKMLLDLAPDAFFHGDNKGNFIAANLSAIELTGYSYEELMKMNMSDLFSKRQLEQKPLKYKSLDESHKINSTRELIKKDKSKLVIEMSSKKMQDGTYQAFIRDVTERKHAEKIQKVFYNISNAVNTTNAIKNLIHIIQNELGTIIDTTNFYVALYDSETNTISLPFMADEKDSFKTFPAGKSLTYYVIKTQKSLLATKERVKELEASGEAEQFGTKSEIWLGIPLKIEGKVIGVFAVQSYTDKAAYNESDMGMLEFIAEQISIAIYRKKAEEYLVSALKKAEKSEKKFRDLFEKSGDAVLILKNRKFVDCNQATVDMLQYNKKEDFLNTNPSQLSPEIQVDGRNSEEKSDEMIELAIKNGTYRFEWNHLRKNGKSFPVEVLLTAISKTSSEEIIHVTWRDITERKLAEEALKKSDERFNLAVNASHDGLYDWDLISNEIYYSEHWKSMLGYTDEELPNDISVWESLSHKEEKEASLNKLKEAIDQKIEHYDVEFRMKHKLGHWVNILSRAQLIYNNKGDAIRAVGTHVDLTEQKEAERNLMEALNKAEESDRLKSAFLANMSHEIRTPMNGIMGFAQLLKEPNIEGDEQLKFINIIEKSGKRMLNIINDLIDISKIEAGQAEIKISDVEINKQTEYLYTFFKPEAEKAGLHLSYKNTLPNPLATIRSDREKIYAILTNLIKNAIKYTDEGNIEFGYNLKSDSKTSGELIEQTLLEFYVKDTGIGIAQNKQETIFERFIQADLSLSSQYEGAGLGLAITKAYVEILGGKIWVESVEGQGSQFYFTLPYHIKSDQASIEVDSNSDIVRNPKKLNILIAEDDETSRIYLTTMIKSICKKVMYARNGIEAVEICKKKQDIDLILMDIKMPKMDGYEASQKIREFNKSVIIIAQTAYALEGDREKAIEAGCNDYISKPIPKNKLFEIVWKHLEKR